MNDIKQKATNEHKRTHSRGQQSGSYQRESGEGKHGEGKEGQVRGEGRRLGVGGEHTVYTDTGS